MSQTSPAKPSEQAAPPVAIEPGFEEALHTFWNKNRSIVLGLCAAALLAVVVREGWNYLSERREKSIQEEYASVAGRPEKLTAFAESYPDHPLAGVAYLQLADNQFSTGDFKQAATVYQKAAAKLKNDALIGRARLGAAMSQVVGGDAAAGEAALKAVSADAALDKNVRCEAAYHLATIAIEAGRLDDAKKAAADIQKIDPTSNWGQRADLLIASQPGATPAISAPTIQLAPPPGK